MNSDRNLLTCGSIWKKMVLFALPVFLGNLFQQLYNTADSLIVGWFLGDHALAAVSSSSYLIYTFVAFFNGAAMGAGILIAQAYGAKDYDTIEKVVHTDVAIGCVTGVIITVVGVTFSPTVLRWMDTPADVLPESIKYFRFYFLGAIFTVMYNIFMGILHAIGDSKHPLYYLILSSIINIILDIVFVGIFRMGVGSAALATTIAQGISAVLCSFQLMHSTGPEKLCLQRLRFHKESLISIIRYGLPGGIQNSIVALANVVVQSHINAFGSVAMAGCGAYSKMEGFATLPGISFVQALSTFVGQNLGAKEYDRVKKGTIFGISCSVVLAALTATLVYIFCPAFIGLFGISGQSVAAGVAHCRIICPFFCLLSFSHCSAGILRGAGKPAVAMSISLLCWCAIRVAYLSIAVPLVPQLSTVSASYPITWILSSSIFLVYLLKVDWMHPHISKPKESIL